MEPPTAIARWSERGTGGECEGITSTGGTGDHVEIAADEAAGQVTRDCCVHWGVLCGDESAHASLNCGS
jgi:hypothetical protein